MSEEFRCWYPLQIRFRDLDPLAHVNNTVYFVYFEEARSYYFDQLKAWLKQWPSAPEHQQIEAITDEDVSPNPRIHTGPRGQHYGMLVKENTCTYEVPLIHSDRAEIGIRVVYVGRSSFIIEHQIRDISDHTRIYATGRSVIVWTNYYLGRSHPVPPSLRSAFEQMESRTFPPPTQAR